jgi:hypothetical protein
MIFSSHITLSIRIPAGERLVVVADNNATQAEIDILIVTE